MKKTLLILISALCLAAPGHAQKVNEAITAEQLKEVKDFLTAKPGEVVKLKFNNRGSYDSLGADGTVRSSVAWDYKDRADVIVPPELTEWFRKISSGSPVERSAKYVFAIAEIDRVPAITGLEPLPGTSGRPIFRLIGREIRTTAKGKQLIW